MSGRLPGVALALASLVLAATTVTAQEPADTGRAAGAPAATPAVAARGDGGPAVPRVAISVTVGTVGMSDLQVQPVRADPEGGEEDATLIRRSISLGGGYQVQGSALLSLTPAWAIRVGGGVGRAELDVDYSGGSEEVLAAARALPSAPAPSVDVASVEAALRFRVPLGRRFLPYAELGVARTWLSLEEGSEGVPTATESLLETQERTAAHLAVGATLALTGALDARLQATTQFLRTPLGAGAAGAPIGGGDGLLFTLEAPRAAQFADAAVEVTRLVRLEAGLSFRLGSVGAGAPSPRGGSAAGRSGSLP